MEEEGETCKPILVYINRTEGNTTDEITLTALTTLTTTFKHRTRALRTPALPSPTSSPTSSPSPYASPYASNCPSSPASSPASSPTSSPTSCASNCTGGGAVGIFEDALCN